MTARRDLPSVNFTYIYIYILYNRQPAVPPGVIAASGSVLLIYPLGRTHTYTRVYVTRIHYSYIHTHIQSCDRRPHTRRRRRLWFSLGLCNVTTFDPIERGLLIRPGTPLPPPVADDFLPG